MLVRIDRKSDAFYIDLTEQPIESSEEVADGIILDYDQNGLLVGIEILDASRKLGSLETFTGFQQLPIAVDPTS
jgi:uncharacterized protein YuzE